MTHLAIRLVLGFREQPVLDVVTKLGDLLERALDRRRFGDSELECSSLIANACFLIPRRSRTVAEVRVSVV